MKNIKKLLSIVMVLAMVLALGVQAFAASAAQVSYVKLPDDYIDHTMVAYKIFEGAQNADQMANDNLPGDFGVGDAALGVTSWVPGVDTEGLLEALSGAYDTQLSEAGKPTFAASTTAVEAAQAISDAMELKGFDAREFAKLVAPHVEKSSKQKTFGPDKDSLTQELQSGYWIIIDKTPGMGENDDFSYSSYLLQVVGGENLTLSKKVDKPTVEKKVNGVDSVVAELGQTVTFTVKAKLPGNYADYKTYYMEFEDTMSKGLTLNAASFTLTWNEAPEGTPDAEKTKDVHDSITPSAYDKETGTTFNYPISDIKAIFPNAKGSDTVTLTYTATVNEDAIVRNFNTVDLKYSNDPNKEGTGKTPDDTVIVFTLFLDVNKVQDDTDGDGKENPLDGAAFRLSIQDGYGTEGAKTWRSLKEAPVEAVKDAEGSVVSYTVDFDRLGAGFYKLEETLVPAGFNKAPDMYFIVEATSTVVEGPDGKIEIEKLEVYHATEAGVKGEKYTEFAVKMDGDDNISGQIDTDVLNTSGMQLPETGGIGTTIFYVVGAILVAAAVILLVTKRRVSGAGK